MMIFEVIMHCDVISCVICISDKVEYLEREETQRNSTKEVYCHFKQSYLQCNKQIVGQSFMS